jgi:hypothetical protein
MYIFYYEYKYYSSTISNKFMLKYNSNIHVFGSAKEHWLSEAYAVLNGYYNFFCYLFVQVSFVCSFSVSIQLQTASMLACSISKVLCVIPLIMDSIRNSSFLPQLAFNLSSLFLNTFYQSLLF